MLKKTIALFLILLISINALSINVFANIQRNDISIEQENTLPESVELVKNANGLYINPDIQKSNRLYINPNSDDESIEITAQMTSDYGIYLTSEGTYVAVNELGGYFLKERIEIDLTDAENLENVISQFEISELIAEGLRKDSKNCIEQGISGTSIVYLTPKDYLEKLINEFTNQNQELPETNIAPMDIYYYNFAGYQLYDDYIFSTIWTRPFNGKGSNASNWASTARTITVTAGSFIKPPVGIAITLIDSGVSLLQNFQQIIGNKTIVPSASDDVLTNIKYSKVDKVTYTYIPQFKGINYNCYFISISTQEVTIKEIHTETYLSYRNSSGGIDTHRVYEVSYPNKTIATEHYHYAAEYATSLTGLDNATNIYFPKEKNVYNIPGINSTDIIF